MLVGKLAVWLVLELVGISLVGWSVGRLEGWLIRWSIGCLVDWLVCGLFRGCCLVGSLVGCLGCGWPVRCFIWLINWLVGWLIVWIFVGC